MRSIYQHSTSRHQGYSLYVICLLALTVISFPRAMIAQAESWFDDPLEDPYGFSYISTEEYLYSMAFGDLDDDGDEDLLVTKSPILGWPLINSYYYHENIGTPSLPHFAPADSSNAFGIPDSALSDVYAFVDIDADGDLDLFAKTHNNFNGGIFYVENSGTPSRANFGEVHPIINPFGLNADNSYYLSDLTFGDLDNDGDLDVVMNGAGMVEFPIEGQNCQLAYRENIGTPQEPLFQSDPTLDIPIWQSRFPPFFTHGKLYDWDCDGDIDILCYTFDIFWGVSNLIFLENTGSSQAARFELDSNRDIKNVFDLRPNNFHNQPWRWLRYADIDGDGDMDAFTEDGFLRNINDCGASAFDRVGDVQNLLIYPNPANSRIYIRHEGTATTSHSIISIYDTQGREVYRDKADITPDEATEVEFFGLAPGLYTIVVTDSEVQYAGRLIVIND